MPEDVELWKLLGGAALGIFFLEKSFDFVARLLGKGRSYEYKGLELLAKAMQNMTDRHDDRWQTMVTQIGEVQKAQIEAMARQSGCIDRLAVSIDRLDAKMGELPCKFPEPTNSGNGTQRFSASRR